MKVPYYCPYCDQTSTRKWNLSTHIKRKHDGLSDPFEMPNGIVYTDRYYQQGQSQQEPDFSSYSWPQIDWADPAQFNGRLKNYNDLLERLRKLSKNELISLVYRIFNFPQFK